MNIQSATDLVTALGTDAFPDRLLQLAECAVAHDAAALMLFRPASPPLVLVDRLKPAERGTLYGDYMHGVYLLSPFYRAAQGLRAPLVARVKQVAPQGFTASEYYRRYFSRIGVTDMLGLLLPCGGGASLFISLSRSEGRLRFSAADVRQATGLVPLLAAATARHIALGGAISAASTAKTSVNPSAKPPSTALTKREAEVVTLILEGHSSPSLAARLRISSETVRVHRRHIYAKLRISSQAELFHWFLAVLGT